MLHKFAKEVKKVVELTAETINMAVRKSIEKANEWAMLQEAHEQIAMLSSNEFSSAISNIIIELSEKTGRSVYTYRDDVVDRLLRGENETEVLYYFYMLNRRTNPKEEKRGHEKI